MSALETTYDQKVAECKKLSAEVSRLTAELAEAKLRKDPPIDVLIEQCAELQNELDELRAQKPVARTNGCVLINNGIEFNGDEWIELYARQVPAAQAVPEGWKLVPILATLEMLYAGEFESYSELATYETVFNAMLAAAPQPPAAQQPTTPDGEALLYDEEAKRGGS